MTEVPDSPDRAGRSAQSEEDQRPAAARDADGVEGDLGEVMGQLARTIQQEHGDVDATLRAITAAAVDSVPGAEMASISLVTGRAIESRAPTEGLPAEIEHLEAELDEGPCLDALREAVTVRVDDFAEDDRWPKLAPEVVRRGVRSSMGFQLYVEGDNLGALDLYSRQPGAFGEESETVGLVLASHASVALAAARQEHNLRRAVDHRDLIGQAKGILMERHRVTADQAFQVLVRASSLTNRKLVDVATELTETGALPRR